MNVGVGLGSRLRSANYQNDEIGRGGCAGRGANSFADFCGGFGVLVFDALEVFENARSALGDKERLDVVARLGNAVGGVISLLWRQRPMAGESGYVFRLAYTFSVRG